MKFKLLVLTMLLTTSRLFSQSYEVLNYNYNSTPINGVKIKTNLPFTNGSQMPSVRIEGYNYGTANTIGINLVWYIYDGAFIQYSASSFGGYTPRIFLVNENSKVVIFIDDRVYFQRFKVSVFAGGMGESSSWFSGWTAADEAINGINTVEVGYVNNFAGNVVIGTTTPASKLTVNGAVSGGDNSNPITIKAFPGHTSWIDLPAVSGLASGIGSGGPGADAWIAYAGAATQWFHNSTAGDIAYRNRSGKLLFGTSTTATMALSNGKLSLGGNTNAASQLDVKGNVTIGSTYASTYAAPANGLFVEGKVGIGTTNLGTMTLAVAGNIGARKIVVTQAEQFPDYVFKKDYKLRTLTDLENYINKYSHLPEVPSAKEVGHKGIDLGSLQVALLKKIEELTLYLIKQGKSYEVLQKQNKSLQKRVESLEKGMK